MPFQRDAFTPTEDLASMTVPRVPADFRTSPEYVAQEAQAVRNLLALGVSTGEPVLLSEEERTHGHSMCAYHLVDNETGETVDGGAASLLHDYLVDGTYGGDGPEYTLVECR